jgi:putative FmdB family regulatory protein
LPIYEYRCRKGHHFEVSQRMSDEPVDVCQVCGEPAERVLFAPAIHFKGTGFYNTDYGRRRAGKETGDGAAVGAESGKDGGVSADGAGADGAGAKKAKEATPKDTAARATGP